MLTPSSVVATEDGAGRYDVTLATLVISVTLEDVREMIDDSSLMSDVVDSDWFSLWEEDELLEEPSDMCASAVDDESSVYDWETLVFKVDIGLGETSVDCALISEIEGLSELVSSKGHQVVMIVTSPLIVVVEVETKAGDVMVFVTPS